VRRPRRSTAPSEPGERGRRALARRGPCDRGAHIAFIGHAEPGALSGWVDGSISDVEGTEVRKLAQLEGKHWWYRERRRLLARALRDARPGTALDVGAAGGGNTRVLHSLGWRATALEYGAEGAAVAAERGLAVLRGDAVALPVRSATMDLVVAFDVLEHIQDDGGAVREIVRVLRPGALALIAVPCDPELWSMHDEAVGHVRRYTRESLACLLTEGGLQIATMDSWNVLLRPVVNMRRRSSTGSDLTALSPLVNGTLRAIIASERVLPVKNRRGVSLVVHAYRPRQLASVNDQPSATAAREPIRPAR
jgi:SAM-dependent methyltransferase